MKRVNILKRIFPLFIVLVVGVGCAGIPQNQAPTKPNGGETTLTDADLLPERCTLEEKYFYETATSTGNVKLSGVKAGENYDLYVEDILVLENILAEKDGEITFSLSDEQETAYLESLEYTLRAEGDITVSEKITFVTKAIRSATDLSVFNITDENTKIEGYYVLANDISFDENFLGNPHIPEIMTVADDNQVEYGFYGVFNGLGHVMSFNVQKFGLFGVMQPGAQIINVAFKNIVQTDYSTDCCALLAFCEGQWKLCNNKKAPPITVNNVYFSSELRPGLYGDGFGSAIFYKKRRQSTNIKNVVIEIPTLSELPVWSNYGYGLFSSDANRLDGAPEIKNLYVISAPHTNGRVLPVLGSKSVSIYASNDYPEYENGSIRFGTEIAHYSFVKRYDSLVAMKEDKSNSYDDFNNCWEKSNGLPIFKTISNIE